METPIAYLTAGFVIMFLPIMVLLLTVYMNKRRLKKNLHKLIGDSIRRDFENWPTYADYEAHSKRSFDKQLDEYFNKMKSNNGAALKCKWFNDSKKFFGNNNLN